MLADFLTFSSSEISLKIQGLELDRLNAIARELLGRLKTVRGLVDLSSNSGEGKPEFRIKIRKDALDKYAGLTPGEISSWLVNAVRGKIAAQQARVWLVNTGWTGGAAGTGRRRHPPRGPRPRPRSTRAVGAGHAPVRA